MQPKENTMNKLNFKWSAVRRLCEYVAGCAAFLMIMAACGEDPIIDGPDIPIEPIDTTKTVVTLNVTDLAKYKEYMGQVIEFAAKPEFSKYYYQLNVTNDLRADSIDFWKVYAPMDSIANANPDNIAIKWNGKKSVPNTANVYDAAANDSVYYNVIPHALWTKAGKISISGYYAPNTEDSVKYKNDGITIDVRPSFQPKEPDIPGEYPINSAGDIMAYWDALQADIMQSKSVNITFGGIITVPNADVAGKLLSMLELDNNNSNVKILGNVRINSGAESVKISPNIIDELMQASGKIAASGGNMLNIQYITDQASLESVLEPGAKVGINKAINFEYPQTISRPDTIAFTGSDEINLSAGLSNLAKRTQAQYVMVPGNTPFAVTNSADLMRITQPGATIAGADIRATQNPVFSSITTSTWNIGGGDKLSDRVQIDTRINSATDGNENGKIVVGPDAPTVNYVLINGWKVISMTHLPLNHQLRRKDNGYAGWNYTANGNMLVVESPSAWGEFPTIVFNELYGTDSHDVVQDFKQPFIPQTAQANDIWNNQRLIQFLSQLEIKVTPDAGAQYNVSDGWMKTFMWLTRNGIWGYPGFAQTFTDGRAYGD
jgi:hypothetical protein